MLDAIERHRPSLTYIAYPNNPTANLWDDGVIDRIVAAVGAQGAGSWCSTRPTSRSRRAPGWRAWPATGRVLVMRTLSKFGLAGVRLGYLAGRARWIAEIDKVRPPYNVSVLNAGRRCSRFRKARRRVRAQTEVLRASGYCTPAGRPEGVPPAFPSDANMILCACPMQSAAFEGMKQRGVLVKNVAGAASAAGRLPAPDRRHAAENDPCSAALTESLCR